MSRVHRLRTTDRLFFVTVNLRRSLEPFRLGEYPLWIEVPEGSRRRLPFLLYGSVLTPDHWHTLIRTGHPLTISQVIHEIKKVSARKLHEQRGTEGPFWQHQFWDRFVRHSKEFAERLMYMHLNPVRKGLVSRPSVVTSKPAIGGRVKTGQRKSSGTELFQLTEICSHRSESVSEHVPPIDLPVCRSTRNSRHSSPKGDHASPVTSSPSILTRSKPSHERRRVCQTNPSGPNLASARPCRLKTQPFGS